MKQRRILIWFGLLIPLLMITGNLRAQKTVLQPMPSILHASDAWRSDSVQVSRFIFYTAASLPPFIPVPRTFKIFPKSAYTYLLVATPFDAIRFMNNIQGVVYWDLLATPAVDAGVINYDMTLNRITTLWNQYPLLDGNGETVSVKENRPDTQDIDLQGRYRVSGLTSAVLDNHATIMTTLITGAGNSAYTGRGVVAKARYSSTDFSLALPDTPTYYTASSIHIQNHSYGTGIQNYYGIQARAFDVSASLDTTLLHVISAGNAGAAFSNESVYASIPGVANITGNFKQAKNILLVGAVLDDGTIPDYSSRGPLFDGRIAPHLVAFGDDGTSGAAALVSGTAVALQQQYKLRMGVPASNTLIKAVLINSARDIGTPGPSFASGFGLLDASAAVETIQEGRFILGSLQNGTSQVFTLPVVAEDGVVRVTLVWNDEAVEPGSNAVLRNDLDLELLNLQTGEILFPWRLHSEAIKDSLMLPATKGRDSINTVEQISAQVKAGMSYQIRVKFGKGTTPTQRFSLVYQPQRDVLWRWDHPRRGDQLVAGQKQWLRWHTDLLQEKSALEMSTNGGQTWQLLQDQVDLAAGQMSVQLPDSFQFVRFRFKTSKGIMETDEVVASPSRAVQFGLVCDKDVLMYWNRIIGADAYIVYRLVGTTMDSLATPTDTTFRIIKNTSSVYAIRPVRQQVQGLRGIGVDYLRQRVGCYIDRFIASPNGPGSTQLNLELGSLYTVTQVEIVKLSSDAKVLLQSVKPQTRNFSVADNQLRQGINMYQARVTLGNGEVVLSDTVFVPYLGSRQFILFPNPVVSGSVMYLLSDIADDTPALILDYQGRLIQELVIKEQWQGISTVGLAKGIYILRVRTVEGTIMNLRFIVN